MDRHGGKPRSACPLITIFQHLTIYITSSHISFVRCTTSTQVIGRRYLGLEQAGDMSGACIPCDSYIFLCPQHTSFFHVYTLFNSNHRPSLFSYNGTVD